MQAKVAANEAELTNILTTAQLQAIKENKTLPADFPFMKVVEILESTDMFEKRKGDQRWTAHELEIAGAFEGMNSTDLQRALLYGTLSVKRVNKAMRKIDEIILKKLGEEAIENP